MLPYSKLHLYYFRCSLHTASDTAIVWLCHYHRVTLWILHDGGYDVTALFGLHFSFFLKDTSTNFISFYFYSYQASVHTTTLWENFTYVSCIKNASLNKPRQYLLFEVIEILTSKCWLMAKVGKFPCNFGFTFRFGWFINYFLKCNKYLHLSWNIYFHLALVTYLLAHFKIS